MIERKILNTMDHEEIKIYKLLNETIGNFYDKHPRELNDKLRDVVISNYNRQDIIDVVALLKEHDYQLFTDLRSVPYFVRKIMIYAYPGMSNNYALPRD